MDQVSSSLRFALAHTVLFGAVLGADVIWFNRICIASSPLLPIPCYWRASSVEIRQWILAPNCFHCESYWFVAWLPDPKSVVLSRGHGGSKLMDPRLSQIKSGQAPPPRRQTDFLQIQTQTPFPINWNVMSFVQNSLDAHLFPCRELSFHCTAEKVRAVSRSQ